MANETPEQTQALEKTTVKVLGEFLSKYESQIAGIAPKHLDREKILRIAQAALTRNPLLLRCTQLSILDCVIKAGQCGLELNGPLRQADMVPYWNGQTKKYEAQFQVRYGGMIELAGRSGEVAYVDAHPVYDSDYFEFEHGDKQYLKHRPNLNREADELIAAYAILRYKDGSCQFEVMNRRDIELIRSRSQMGKKTEKDPEGKGPWRTDEAEMWRKSPIKRLLKRARVSAEVQRVIGYDNQSELGLRQDTVFDGFDFDQAQIRAATEEKSEQVKERLGKAKLQAVEPKREEQGKETTPQAPPQEEGRARAQGVEKPAPPAESSPSPNSEQQDLYTETPPVEDRAITREEWVQIKEILDAKYATKTLVLGKFAELGYTASNQIKLKDHAGLLEWARSLPQGKPPQKSA